MIRVIIAFLASVLTGVQTYLVYTEGKAFCFNSGCEIVESLTAVPALYFNLAGFLYFQVLFWCLLWGRSGSVYWNKFARILLMAGLVAEAVLLFFQHSIAHAFCTYCLIVCGCVVILNILSGLRQVFRGIILFSAVLVACFSLQFNAGTGGAKPLQDGAVAYVSGEAGRPELYLFFSETCPHCEAVIEALDGENVCGLHFNPVELLPSFSFPKAVMQPEYDPSINLGFLKNLAITEVPVLVAAKGQVIQVISGETSILNYLEEECRQKVAIDYQSGQSTSSPINYVQPSSYKIEKEEGCSVDEDCVKPETPAVKQN
jgi:thiol-disulfide isomerase/thioredoxin